MPGKSSRLLVVGSQGGGLLKASWQWFGRVDAVMIRFMTAQGTLLLRLSLAVVFIWFGGLKIAGRSPVADLVAGAVYWVNPSWFVPVLGLWEVLVGLGLLLRMALRPVLLLFWLQMAGTLLVPVIRPDLAFVAGNPLLLTTTGEFVIKNLVLIAAGLVIGSTVSRKRDPR